MDEFKEMPEVPEEEKRKLRESFPDYLFFTNIRRGVRDWRCTACGSIFSSGRLKRTEKPEERELIWARMGEHCNCPKCGKLCTVKSSRANNPSRLDESKYVVFLLPKGKNEVWLRCFTVHMYYCVGGGIEYYEKLRCRLMPGEAVQWEPSWFGWYKRERFAEPFTYNYSCTCVKKSYVFIQTGAGSGGTFLKYSGALQYGRLYDYDVPYVKYLCNYAERPSLEMAVKMGMKEIAMELVEFGLPNKRVIDWGARTPWEFVRLNKKVFNVWYKAPYRGSRGLRILKLYRAMKGKTEKDMTETITLLDYCRGSLRDAKTAAKAISTAGKSVSFAIRYMEKISAQSGGGCHCCPGITEKEAFNMWLDFADMAKREGITGKINMFPKDLKAAHDGLLRQREVTNMRENAKRYHEMAAKDAKSKEKEFPKVGRVYKRIRKKYEYSDGKFLIAVPEKLEDIIFEGLMLNTCLSRTGRYFERIEDNESYLFFLRKAEEPELPWYTIEAEPGGTVRQKRTKNDCQNSDLQEAEEFLRKWQEVVGKRMTAADKRQAEKSRAARIQEFEELRAKNIKVSYGQAAGRLLADILEKDLMEA